MAKSITTQIEELKLKESKLKARIQLLKAKSSSENRKKDTRRKILIGGVILAKVNRGEWNSRQLQELLDSELKHNRDRELFDLKLNEEPSQ